MNKKLLISLTLLPLLASCSGFPVSNDEALNIINNIEADAVSSTGSSYKMTSIRTLAETIEKTVTTYDKDSKFYHTYTITSLNVNTKEQTGRVSENWKFVMPYTSKNSSGEEQTKDYIFDIERKILPSTINEEIEKQYTVTYENYSIESWEKIAKEYEDRLLRRFSDGLEHSRLLINSNPSSLELKSFNEYSLYLNYKDDQAEEIQRSEYTIDIFNSKLMSIKSLSSGTKSEITYDYSGAEITYPSFKVTIV